jgi:5-methylcytosine-specific restriction endonuclease McrA
MQPDETPRQLGEDDELPDDLGSRIGDTLTFSGSGSYIRAISADEARRRLAPRKLTDLDASEIDKAIAFAKGYMTATGELGPEPGSVLDSRPRRRGLNRLIPTGRRRAARERAAAPPLPPRPPVMVPPARLTIELVPKTSWYNNVRALVDELGWDRIRRQVYRQADYRCEICGGKGPEHPVECHEVWRYDDRTHVQTLVRMIALCPACHQAKHIGFANVKGKGAQARAHLARVNGWTPERADAYINEAFQVWAQRSGGPWTLDLEGLRPYVLGSEYAHIVRQAAIPPERSRTE